MRFKDSGNARLFIGLEFIHSGFLCLIPRELALVPSLSAVLLYFNPPSNLLAWTEVSTSLCPHFLWASLGFPRLQILRPPKMVLRNGVGHKHFSASWRTLQGPEGDSGILSRCSVQSSHRRTGRGHEACSSVRASLVLFLCVSISSAVAGWCGEIELRPCLSLYWPSQKKNFI